MSEAAENAAVYARRIMQLERDNAALREWQRVALFLGEGLAPTGPDGYYDMSPQEWLSWASKAIDAQINAAKQEDKP